MHSRDEKTFLDRLVTGSGSFFHNEIYRPAVSFCLLPAGFSLLELMVVLAVLAIVAAVAVPSFSPVSDHSRLELAVSELAGACRYARAEARRSGVAKGVKIDPDRETYTVVDSDGVTGLYHPVSKKPFAVDFTQDRMLRGVDIVSADGGSAAYTVGFNAAGRPDQSTDLVVVLAGYGLTRQVVVAETTGRVSVLP